MEKLMEYKMIIDGKEVEAADGRRFEIINPANEEVIGSAPLGSEVDADKAIKSAEKAFSEWKKVPASKRAELLLNLAELIDKEKERLAKMLCVEHGKVYKEAVEEMIGAIGYIVQAAHGAKRIEGDIVPSDFQNEQIWIQKVPYGVTVGLCAWNFPVALAARKFGPALAAGNVMVVKPPKDCPLTVIEVGKLALEAGIPPGVMNIVTGTGEDLGRALVKHPLTRLVSHTGSTKAGQQIIRDSSHYVTDLLLELGGNAPFIVMNDADIERAVDAAITARFYNNGQVCTCNERMYLHKDIYDDFMGLFISKVKELKIGDQFSGADIGPKINKQELEHVEKLVNDAIKAGVKVEVGGKRPSGESFRKGFWYEPTVLTNVKQEFGVIQEEIFGPVVPVLKVDNFDQAIEYANDCEYGLSAYIWTKDLRRVMQTISELDVGEIYVNRGIGELPQAYHSGMKKSGIGGEDGKYGLENYLHKKTYYINFT